MAETNETQAAPQAAADTPQPQKPSILERAEVPLHPYNSPSARIEGDNLQYLIITMRPNSPEMNRALETLESMGCTCRKDHEHSLDASAIYIQIPKEVAPEEYEAQKIVEETQGAELAAMPRTGAQPEFVLDPLEAC